MTQGMVEPSRGETAQCGGSLERVKTMAKVFRGKVAIPGDQIEAYFEALEKFEIDKQPMHQQLEQCARDFEQA